MESAELPRYDHLTFVEWVARTVAHWRIVAVTCVVAIVAAIIAVIFVPPVYRTRASFVANSSSSSKMPQSLPGGGALAGLATQLGVSSGADPSESPQFYMELISSRELLTRLLQSRFRDPRGNSARDSATLLDILKIRESDPGRRLEVGIKKMSRAITGDFEIKTNLVWIDVDARWAELSSAVANRTLQLVTAFNREQRVSRIRSKRVYLESRVDSAKVQLHQAEERQRSFYDQNRSWRTSPDLVIAEGQLRRDVDIETDLYLNLKHQLETARIDEFNDAALITVVDSAVPPRKAQWPRFGLLTFSTLMIGILLGSLFAGSAAVLDDWRARNPASSASMRGAYDDARRDISRTLSLRGRKTSGGPRAS
jgi:uncharacterized protein involved in exopolysaccharide biosynthesis